MVYSRARWWVGYAISPEHGGPLLLIKSAITPTEQSHGAVFCSVMGPFVTKRAALFYVQHGQGNPHTCTVGECEAIARDYARKSGPYYDR